MTNTNTTAHQCSGCPECPIPAHVAEAIAQRNAYLAACKEAGIEGW